MIIVEDVPLELKGTEGIVRNEIPEAEVIGTAANEASFWRLIKQQQPDLVLLDLGLGGSTTVGVELRFSSSRARYSTRNYGSTCSMLVPTASSSRVASC